MDVGFNDKKDINRMKKVLQLVKDALLFEEDCNSISMPTPKMRLFCVDTGDKLLHFNTKQELNNFIRKNSLAKKKICILEYFDYFAGRFDVIKCTYSVLKQEYYTAVDDSGYGIYDMDRSYKRGEHFWKFESGNIKKLYEVFRKNGIIFHDDVYSRLEHFKVKMLEKNC